jgi:hypothetical protein
MVSATGGEGRAAVIWGSVTLILEMFELQVYAAPTGFFCPVFDAKVRFRAYDFGGVRLPTILNARHPDPV